MRIARPDPWGAMIADLPVASTWRAGGCFLLVGAGVIRPVLGRFGGRGRPGRWPDFLARAHDEIRADRPELVDDRDRLRDAQGLPPADDTHLWPLLAWPEDAEQGNTGYGAAGGLAFCGLNVSWRASMATNSAIFRSRVSARLTALRR